jgi:hypothetical protein
MKLKYIVCSELASFDQFSGRASLYHVIDQIVAPTYPVALPSLSVVIGLERQPEEPDTVECRISISFGPQELASFPATVQFGNALLARALGNLQSFVVPAAGTMHVNLFIGDQREGSWDIVCLQVGEFQFQQPLQTQGPETRATAP